MPTVFEMERDIFHINTAGVDTEKIVSDIKASVKKKLEQGLYSGPDLIRAEQGNLANIVRNDEFSRVYIESLRSSVFVDINDFPIYEKRRFIGLPLRVLKTVLWKLLKFYTYRLWSQQNHVNGLILTAVDGMEEKYSARIKDIENRLEAMEKKLEKKDSADRS